MFQEALTFLDFLFLQLQNSECPNLSMRTRQNKVQEKSLRGSKMIPQKSPENVLSILDIEEKQTNKCNLGTYKTKWLA